MRHKLIIASHSDTKAYCSAKDWYFLQPGEVSQEEIEREFQKHLKEVRKNDKGKPIKENL